MQISNKTFYDLYNISLDFKGKNMITLNEKGRYYKVLINEYPKYEGNIFTGIVTKIVECSLLIFQYFHL